MGDLHPITWRPESSKKADLLESERLCRTWSPSNWNSDFLIFYSNWNTKSWCSSLKPLNKNAIIYSLYFSPWDMDRSCPPALLGLHLAPSLFLFTLRPWDMNRSCPPALLGLHLAHSFSRSCDFAHYPMSQFLLTNLTIYVLLVFFLWRTLTNTPCFILSFDILTICSVPLTVFLTLENQVLSSCLCHGKKSHI